MDSNSTVLKYFSGEISRALLASRADIYEIRLRSGKPLSVTADGKCLFLCRSGELTSCGGKAVLVSAEELRRCFEAVCRYSVHSCQNQINMGFVTVAGGHRAGICGSAVYSQDGKIENIKYINSINFRIAREIIGAADAIINTAMSGGLKSVLIFGEPCSGKTTILRDLCRQVGDEYTVSLIDERGEIAAVSGGAANNRIGLHTDIFSGFSKKDGIIRAVRSMSPRMIFCDEIGSDEDLLALELARRSGVKAAATVHCGSIRELKGRSGICRLLKEGLFDYAVLAKDRSTAGIYKSAELFADGEWG